MKQKLLQTIFCLFWQENKKEIYFQEIIYYWDLWKIRILFSKVYSLFQIWFPHFLSISSKSVLNVLCRKKHFQDNKVIRVWDIMPWNQKTALYLWINSLFIYFSLIILLLMLTLLGQRYILKDNVEFKLTVKYLLLLLLNNLIVYV